MGFPYLCHFGMPPMPFWQWTRLCRYGIFQIVGRAMVPNQNREVPMNDAALTQFRALAEAMQTEPTTWEWTGPHMSQRMFGITETRAKTYAERHGGEARRMD
jgi:hypothetical protein